MQQGKRIEREKGIPKKLDRVNYKPSALTIEKLKSYLNGINDKSASQRVCDNCPTA
jgi:hypothetical protein